MPNAILTPVLTGGDGTPTYNLGIAETYSWIPINNNQNRPLFARAGYITNLSDLSISLSASNLNIGSVSLKDGDSGALADVVSNTSAQYGTQNSLRVVTQDFQSTIDSISIGDLAGRNAVVDRGLSALNVTIAEQPGTYYSIDNFDIHGTDGFKFDETERPFLALRVKPNTSRTVVVDEYNLINTDTSHICGYRWYTNPTLSQAPTWIDLTPNIQYTFLNEKGVGSSNTITAALSNVIHSGFFASRNTEHDEGVSFVALSGGAVPPVLVLTVQHINGNTDAHAFITTTIKDLG